ncbi:hypothetical protein [Persephonella sp.]
MPKFRSPHYISKNLIKLYEKVERPITIDFEVLEKISERENLFRPLRRRIFSKVSEILEEKGYVIFEVPEENMICIIKKDYILEKWNYLDEEDLEYVLDEFENIEEEEEVEN